MTRENIPTVYDPASVETKWYNEWEAKRVFHAEPKMEGQTDMGELTKTDGDAPPVTPK